MHSIFENETDKVEVYASPRECNECEMMAFDVYRRDSVKLGDGSWRVIRNQCIAPNLRFGNDTLVDPATMNIVEAGGEGIYDFLQNATPASLGMASMEEKIRPYLVARVEAFLLVNNLIPLEALQ